MLELVQLEGDSSLITTTVDFWAEYRIVKKMSLLNSNSCDH